MRKRIVTFFHFNKQVIVAEYLADNVIKYSASLAYYTTLSLAPMLVIIISVSGILFGREAMTGEVYKQINGLVGSDAATQIQTTMQHIHLSKDTPFATIISFIILIIGATGIFGEMQDSLNKIWGLKTTLTKSLVEINFEQATVFHDHYLHGLCINGVFDFKCSGCCDQWKIKYNDCMVLVIQ